MSKSKSKKSYNDFCDFDRKNIKKTKGLAKSAEAIVNHLILELRVNEYCVTVEYDDISEMLKEIGNKPFDKMPIVEEKYLHKEVGLLQDIGSEVSTILNNGNLFNAGVVFNDKKNQLKPTLLKYKELILEQSFIVQKQSEIVINELHQEVFNKMCKLDDSRDQMLTDLKRECTEDKEKAKEIFFQFLKEIFILQTSIARLNFAVNNLQHSKDIQKGAKDMENLIEESVQEHLDKSKSKFVKELLNHTKDKFDVFEKKVHANRQLIPSVDKSLLFDIFTIAVGALFAFYLLTQLPGGRTYSSYHA